MNALEIQKCSACESSLIDDVANGEIICSGCGIVVAEQMEDHGPEVKSTRLEDKMKLARATGQTTYSQHDLGIATEISMGSKDFSGKTINSEIANQMTNLRKWQKRVRISSSRDRRLSNVLGKISEVSQNCSLPKNVVETASKIYRSLDGKHIQVKGKSVLSISAAVIYLACKQCAIVRSLEEIIQATTPMKEAKAKV